MMDEIVRTYVGPVIQFLFQPVWDMVNLFYGLPTPVAVIVISVLYMLFIVLWIRIWLWFSPEDHTM